jgi:hypothetical protein
MDLLHVRRDDHNPQTDPLPGALPALWRHNVRDLEVAVSGDTKGLARIAPTGWQGTVGPTVSSWPGWR